MFLSSLQDVLESQPHSTAVPLAKLKSSWSERDSPMSGTIKAHGARPVKLRTGAVFHKLRTLRTTATSQDQAKQRRTLPRPRQPAGTLISRTVTPGSFPLFFCDALPWKGNTD